MKRNSVKHNNLACFKGRLPLETLCSSLPLVEALRSCYNLSATPSQRALRKLAIFAVDEGVTGDIKCKSKDDEIYAYFQEQNAIKEIAMSSTGRYELWSKEQYSMADCLDCFHSVKITPGTHFVIIATNPRIHDC